MTREELITALRNFEGSDALGNGDFSVLNKAADMLEADMPKPKPAVKLNGRGGRRRNMHGSSPSMTPDQVREARALRVEQTKPIKELMAKYGVSRSTLRNALYGIGYYEEVL